MSHIFEALQRAQLERRALAQPERRLLGEVLDPLPLFDESSGLSDKFMGETTAHKWSPDPQAVPCLLESGPVIEQFRGLRSRLMQARQELGLKSVLISSGMPSEGKSFISLNLAISLVRHNVNRVLLIDGDLRRPSLHKVLGTPNLLGLSDYLAGKAELSEIMQRNQSGDSTTGQKEQELANLAFIPAGVCRDGAAAELAATGGLSTLIAAAAQSFDWILIDSSPVLAVTDAVDLARSADGVLLAARHGRTPFDVLQRAQAAFRQSRILGVVLNAGKGSENKYYGYYGDGESADGLAQKEKGREK